MARFDAGVSHEPYDWAGLGLSDPPAKRDERTLEELLDWLEETEKVQAPPPAPSSIFDERPAIRVEGAGFYPATPELPAAPVPPAPVAWALPAWNPAPVEPVSVEPQPPAWYQPVELFTPPPAIEPVTVEPLAIEPVPPVAPVAPVAEPTFSLDVGLAWQPPVAQPEPETGGLPNLRDATIVDGAAAPTSMADVLAEYFRSI
jgi:hypothetical protein